MRGVKNSMLRVSISYYCGVHKIDGHHTAISENDIQNSISIEKLTVYALEIATFRSSMWIGSFS